MSNTDVIVAIATPPGRGGIGILRASGKSVDRLVEGLAGGRVPPRQATLRRFRGEGGEVVDRGIALYFPAPRSYTGEDVLELHAHGSPAVLRSLLQRCIELGARVAEPGEFTKRAFLNGRIDLAQAEAVADLIDASTQLAARSAFHSLQGDFSRRITEMGAELDELRVLVEAGLDFPEEDLEETAREEIVARMERLAAATREILAGARKGALLREGMRVVLTGRPNVGKSSLLNRLARQELALVTEIPGTTRDAIQASVDLAGVPVHFTDTAGLRQTSDPVERLGVERSWSLVAGADAIVLVMDATAGESPADTEILGKLPPAIPRIRLMNKIDLLGREPAKERIGTETRVWLSALTGAGIELLQQSLLEKMGWGAGEEGLYMARARHVEALEKVLACLQRARSAAAQSELLAEDLRMAQDALGDITGKRTSDDLLGEIFSRFCIGK